MKTKQSGLQRMGPFHETLTPNGLLVRGVVMVTYVLDDPNHPSVLETGDDGRDPVSVYCDVLVYSNKRGLHSHYLTKVPVLQDRGGLHDGRIWKPKATTIDVTESPVDPNTGTLVGNLDGDHVLIGFMDDAMNQPIILGGVPHPSHDVGNLEKPKGHRRGLIVADGHPDFWKHHGTFYGIDTNGDFLVDTTFGNDGEINADGTEADPPTDGKGAQKHSLPQDAEARTEWFDMVDPTAPVSKSYQSIKKDSYELSLNDVAVFLKLLVSALELKLDGGATLKAEGNDADAILTLGNGVKSAIIAEAWETFFDGSFKTWVVGHTHPTGVGPSGYPAESGTFPAYSSSGATSTKLLFPDG